MASVITCHPCAYRKEGDSSGAPCSGKVKYGPFCYKHRHLYLVEGNRLQMDRFTGQGKDYVTKDLKHFYRSVVQGPPIPQAKKEVYFTQVQNWVHRVQAHQRQYETESLGKRPGMVKIQSLCRGRLQRKKGLLIQCHNEEDFFTFEPIRDIDPMYVFSYVDPKGFRWGFDIRSLSKLVSMNYPNPYTMEPIAKGTIQEMKQTLDHLKTQPGYQDIVDEVVRDRKQELKQLTVDIFSMIERSGYPCNIDWFLQLTLRRLKILYRQLEDIWNYRTHLTRDMKRCICPPDGRVFTTPVQDVQDFTRIEDIQGLILNDVIKFTRAVSDEDKKLGYMYFLIGLGHVSERCWTTHTWLRDV